MGDDKPLNSSDGTGRLAMLADLTAVNFWDISDMRFLRKVLGLMMLHTWWWRLTGAARFRKYLVRTSSLQMCFGRKSAHDSFCCAQVGGGQWIGSAEAPVMLARGMLTVWYL